MQLKGRAAYDSTRMTSCTTTSNPVTSAPRLVDDGLDGRGTGLAQVQRGVLVLVQLRDHRAGVVGNSKGDKKGRQCGERLKAQAGGGESLAHTLKVSKQLFPHDLVQQVLNPNEDEGRSS